ncbi:MAG TPA: hypothetical protein VK487_06370 [Candidatus Bathyarchaeia archaeon]|nr:hypothetical protein [Candidatus Bathyarchaeia archaeon]
METNIIKNSLTLVFKGKKKKFEIIATILHKIELLDSAIVFSETLKTATNAEAPEKGAAQFREIRKQWIDILNNVCKANE